MNYWQILYKYIHLVQILFKFFVFFSQILLFVCHIWAREFYYKGVVRVKIFGQFQLWPVFVTEPMRQSQKRSNFVDLEKLLIIIIAIKISEKTLTSAKEHFKIKMNVFNMLFPLSILITVYLCSYIRQKTKFIHNMIRAHFRFLL